MAPTAKPKAPTELWKRTGHCIVKRCGCERFVPGGKQDTFPICICTHTQHSHAKATAGENGKVDS